MTKNSSLQWYIVVPELVEKHNVFPLIQAIQNNRRISFRIKAIYLHLDLNLIWRDDSYANSDENTNLVDCVSSIWHLFIIDHHICDI